MLQTDLKLKEARGENNIDTAEIRGLLGVGLRLVGKREQALNEFHNAIPLLVDR